ncbi:hypothetical protein J2W42_003554 [Rhizobium tibeticum]|uniref:DUF1236 domain-containing protein n=1 Tax=Rhizobium tibeticum TaxID=501024 RepID=A0A1H8RW33_9HYPH|nr:DUF1236 domain-containing protein [Rhizobium tibeticum]MDP9810691.1 hypothetical protein [Rhizobium tibeticum]SEI08282.1 hypothetical protein RTCCBAU85039_4309 [Rhizobium tibeticum]SEO70517.1 Protein of unknown function [Rhizobium tibeticum]
MKALVTAATAALMLTGTAMAQTTTVVTVPGEVRTYITEQEVPSVVYDGDIIVGTELPSSVEIHTIPSNDAYGYTVVNKKRVIVDPHTHRVIEVIN